MAVVAWFCFPDDIESARFLSRREKQVAKHMVCREQTADVVNHTGLRMKDFLAAFKDYKSESCSPVLSCPFSSLKSCLIDRTTLNCAN